MLHASVFVPLSLWAMHTAVPQALAAGPGHGTPMLAGYALALIAGFLLPQMRGMRLLRWRIWRHADCSDLWRLGLGYAWVASGIALMGSAILFGWRPRIACLHAITVGGLGTLSLNVMAHLAVGRRCQSGPCVGSGGRVATGYGRCVQPHHGHHDTRIHAQPVCRRRMVIGIRRGSDRPVAADPTAETATTRSVRGPESPGPIPHRLCHRRYIPCLPRKDRNRPCLCRPAAPPTGLWTPGMQRDGPSNDLMRRYPRPCQASRTCRPLESCAGRLPIHCNQLLENPVQRETIEIPCDDGIKLAGELLIPERPKAVVQFNCGTAAKRGVYIKLLTYLCENGFLCCIWDYRGSGESDGALRNSRITYSDYGTRDMPAVKAYLDQRFPGLPLLIVAHSAGGQQIGFMPNWQGIKGVINLGVSSGHFKYMPLAYRIRAWLFFYGVVPVSARLTGYVAASRLGVMEDLPSAVAREWRDWLAVTDYFFDAKFLGRTVPEGAFKEFNFPIHNYHATDDAISTPRNIESFWRHVESSAGITLDRIAPEHAGLDRMDHFGYFKSAMKDSLWADMVERLDDFAAKA